MWKTEFFLYKQGFNLIIFKKMSKMGLTNDKNGYIIGENIKDISF